MSPPPLPLPSKAAIRALRSLALGTSCAIGVLIEDRRRRISTLKTAVANKQKLQSSRQYHHNSLEELSWQLGAATVLEYSLQGYEKEDHRLERHADAGATRYAAYEGATAMNSEVQNSSIAENDLGPIQRPQPVALQSSPPPPTTFQAASLITKRQIRSSMSNDSPNFALISKAIGTRQPTLSATLGQSQDDLIRSIEDLLANTDKESLDRAVKLFILGGPSTPSNPLLDRWIELSIHISRKCQASGMWEEASEILTTIISLGPIDEAKYLAYNPLPIIESHLCRHHPEIPPSADRVISAAKLYLPKFKATPHPRGMDWERMGRSLVLETLSSRLFILSQNVYWRTLCWAPKPVEFVGWAIHTFFQHSDHKTVVRIFLSQYSRMKPSNRQFNETMDCVVESVLAMKGAHADEILKAFAEMDCPGNGELRSRWVMRLLQAHWARQEGLSQTIELFEKAVSLGLLEKIAYPQGVYRTLIEMAVKAGDEKVAYAYADELTREYPDMKKDIALKLAGLKAKEGEWDSVLEAFRQVRPSELAEPTLYNDAFIYVLKVFADSHSAAETQDFALTFIRDMGIEFHPYMVTLIAKRYAEDRDMRGFVTWLELCSREGFGLDAGFFNSVLHNCSTTWKLSFPELCAIHSHFKELNPHYADEVTQRILTRAAHHEGRDYNYSGHTKKAITVSRMTHRGRTTNQRDIYHAMNQELMRHKPTSAVMVYKRAIRFGMPFNGHCFRLAILATAQSKRYGSDYALALLQDAHAEGRDVEAAISTFIRHDIAEFNGNPQDVLIHIRNLLHRLESLQIPISTTVLTHMAYVCVQIRQHEKAIILCNIARDRSGSSHPFLSKKSFMVFATAYSELLDIAGMNSVIDHLSSDSKYSTDKVLLSHLRSIRRLVRKKDPSDRRTATLEEILDRGILQIVQMRAKVRTEGKLISHETLRIVGDALADLQRANTEEGTSQTFTPTDTKWKKLDLSVERQVVANGPLQLLTVS
ncbi:hypothetical protein F4860DRAFT_486031 [Xylaria cubensis]|nr:hypothetical protein F4860DRAFT_486031 [Xylaria cubensis]